MTPIELLERLVVGELTKKEDVMCNCGECTMCAYKIIKKIIGEKSELPNINIEQMEARLMTLSLGMQEFFGIHTKSILLDTQSFIRSILNLITEEDKKRLIQLAINKIETEDKFSKEK